MLAGLTLVVLALIVGILIGCVGIGGVLLPPALTYIGGFDLHMAMATSMWSFLFTGAVGTIAYSRRNSVDWRMVLWLGAGTVPSAVLGAVSNTAMPGGVLTVLLAALIVAAGVNALTKSPSAEHPANSFGHLLLFLIGAVVGFGSALTGTGGPVLLVPILIFMRAPILSAIAASQVVSIPVALFSTFGYVLFSRVDFTLGTALGLIAAVGVVIGMLIAHAVPILTLRRIVAVSLVGVGVLITVRVLATGA
jgi:uncharacterized membrane protein YfcA